MSKRYQYFAKKRESHLYFNAKTLCKNKCPHNHVTCKICLRSAGRTRQVQQLKYEQSMDKLKIKN